MLCSVGYTQYVIKTCSAIVVEFSLKFFEMRDFTQNVLAFIDINVFLCKDTQ